MTNIQYYNVHSCIYYFIIFAMGKGMLSTCFVGAVH